MTNWQAIDYKITDPTTTLVLIASYSLYASEQHGGRTVNNTVSGKVISLANCACKEQTVILQPLTTITT